MESNSEKKIGLALGSGSARGWAHIGVLQALTEAGVRVSCVAGTSIGALVGAFFATGKMDVLRNMADQFRLKHFLLFADVTLPRSGLIDGTKIAGFIRRYVTARNIQDLPVPFAVVATDMATGSQVVIREGDLIEAVRASISLPGIFTPVKRQGVFLVDGGLVNPVPVSVVRNMGADCVIAVDLNSNMLEHAPKRARIAASHVGGARRLSVTRLPAFEFLRKKLKVPNLALLRVMRKWREIENSPSILDVLVVSARIMEAQITAANLKNDPPDLLIQPAVAHIGLLEFGRSAEAIEQGYLAAREKLSRCPEICKERPAPPPAAD